MEFEEHTTIYALWQKPAVAPKLAAPVPHVEGNTVVWEGIENRSAYSIEIKGPEGFTAMADESLSAPTFAVPFSASLAATMRLR